MTQSSFGAPRGIVDLAALATPAPAAREGVLQVTEAGFPEVIEKSNQVPVIVLFTSARATNSAPFNDEVERIVVSYGDSLAFGVADVDREQQVAAAFQIQAVPTVVAILGGRPVPLFQGVTDEASIRAVLDQVVELAVQQGLTGEADTPGQEPAEEPLPPLHQAAFDAIEQGDFAAAVAAYEQALSENPKDADARAGKAQVQLMQRTATLNAAEVRKNAAELPEDADAQLAVADLDIAGGHVEDAFARLISLVANSYGTDRDKVRIRLIELFDVVGGDDPRVVQARRELSAALF